jgi:hypothetical protein
MPPWRPGVPTTRPLPHPTPPHPTQPNPTKPLPTPHPTPCPPPKTDVVTHGPEALKKYSGDRSVVEAWNEAAQIIEQQQAGPAEQQPQAEIAGQQQQRNQQPQPNGGGGGGPWPAAAPPPPPPLPPPPGFGPEGMAAARAALGVSPAELIGKMAARPELMARVRDPAVAKALAEVAAAPWKVVKYLFNREVMSTLRVRRGMGRRGAAWGGAASLKARAWSWARGQGRGFMGDCGAAQPGQGGAPRCVAGTRGQPAPPGPCAC